VRLVITGPDFNKGSSTSTTLLVRFDEDGSAEARIAETGFFLMPEGERMFMDEPNYGSPYQTQLQGFDFYALDERVEITAIEVPTDRLPARHGS